MEGILRLGAVFPKQPNVDEQHPVGALWEITCDQTWQRCQLPFGFSEVRHFPAAAFQSVLEHVVIRPATL